MGTPKDGRAYQVIVVCRVSSPGEGKQDERSLDDQEAMYGRWLDANLGGPYESTVIAGSGSGELLNRSEYQRLIDLVNTGHYDLVLCEDLGRIVRRIHAHLVCEHAEDMRTRLYAINDHVDTAAPGWREASIFAAFHHERSNRDTSERIKRTHRNRFANGGCLREPAYGWIKPAGAKHDSEQFKDPAAEPIYQEWFRMLDEDAATYADVARWLRSKGVRFPTRRRGVLRDPDAKAVARHTGNPMLKGLRERNRRKSRRINKTGEYVSEKAAPGDLLTRRAPHLAFFDDAYFDRVVAKARARNARFRRSEDPANDPCLHRSRRDSRYPGRAAGCVICGRPFLWGGHGQTDRMMCKGVRLRRCWNGATFDGPAAARQIVSAILDEAERLPAFDEAFTRILEDEHRRLDGDRQAALDGRRTALAKVGAEIANIVAFVKAGTAAGALAAELAELEARQRALVAEIEHMEKQPSTTFAVPPVQEIRDLVRGAVAELAVEDEEFARVMRRLVPRIVLIPVRTCDGGKVVLRARFRVHLADLLPDRRAAEALRAPLERVLTIDLFEPPQRVKFRAEIVAARAAGRTEREAAADCGITVAAAQRAMVLQRKMDELGIDDPYLPVLEPPQDLPKLRGHLHPDYRFEPIVGAGEL
jgi:DNA invertase Pin-like site-specific DNA recombinase